MDALVDQEVPLPAGFLSDLAIAPEEQSVIEVATRWLSRIIPSERSSIALVADDPTCLDIYAVGQDLIFSMGSRLPISDSLVGAAYVGKRTINAPELGQFGLTDSKILHEAGLRSALVAPLLAGDQCLGTLNIGSSIPSYFGPRHEALLSSVATLVAAFMQIHQQIKLEHIRARTDQLTGQLNRFAILEQLGEQLRCPVSELPSVLYIDMDGFKAINDGHGHHVGDEVLRCVVERIRSVVGDAMPVGRLGGDEFLVVVAADPDAHRATFLADELVAAVTKPIHTRSALIEPRLSVGIAAPHGPGRMSADALLIEADQAMYVAKSSERSVVVADLSIRSRAELLRVIDRDLDAAMASGAITFDLQPIRDLATWELRGAEALVRWHHPTHGSVPPPLLIERIELSGKTEAFTKWCINTVASHWQSLRKLVPACADMSVSINLTARQLRWEHYADAHLAMLERYGLRPQDVVVEVVESDQIAAGDFAEATLRRLAEHSVTIALDDFGTGHNALRYFSMFPIHEIKFDRSLISTILTNPPVRAIVEGLAQVAHRLGIASLAEGIETVEEMDLCRELGLNNGQGYFLGRPMSVSDFELLLKSSCLTHREVDSREQWPGKKEQRTDNRTSDDIDPLRAEALGYHTP